MAPEDSQRLWPEDDGDDVEGEEGKEEGLAEEEEATEEEGPTEEREN